MSTICLVIPAYNEGDRLPVENFRNYLASHPALSLLLVDDGSSDATWEKFQELRKEAPEQVTLLRLKRNSGKGEAVRQGMLAAAGKYDFSGYWDADLATPLEEADAFEKEFRENSTLNICCGCRLERLGTDIRRKASRHHIGRLIAAFISHILGVPFYDTQCGAKIFRSACIAELFTEPFRTRWLFDVEIFHRYIASRGRENASRTILEYPLHQWHDIAGSKLSWSSALPIFKELFTLWLISRNKRRNLSK